MRALASEEVERFVDELWLPFQRELAEHDADRTLPEDLRAPGLARRRERAADPDAETLLAVEAGEPDEPEGPRADTERFVGFASFARGDRPVLESGPDCAVSAVYVVPERRREGVGSALLDGCLERAATRGCVTVSLTVPPGNDAALALYERAGFRLEGHRLVRRVDAE